MRPAQLEDVSLWDFAKHSGIPLFAAPQHVDVPEVGVTYGTVSPLQLVYNVRILTGIGHEYRQVWGRVFLSEVSGCVVRPRCAGAFISQSTLPGVEVGFGDE